MKRILRRRPPAPALPGRVGPARVGARVADLLPRLRAGDVAIVDQVDLDRADGEALASAGVAGVVNAAPCISGRYPALGAQVLVDAGVPVLDRVGGEVLRVRDGARVSVHEGVLVLDGGATVPGRELTRGAVARAMREARAGVDAQLGALAAGVAEHLRGEQAVLLDGLGPPALRTDLRGRPVVVVVPGPDAAADLRSLRSFVRDRRPVLVGVEGGADVLRAAGHRPDLVVGVGPGITDAALTGGAEVVLVGPPDGSAPGRERLTALGVEASTPGARGRPQDAALLLAAAGEAQVVVLAGTASGLVALLDEGRAAVAGTVLTRLAVGDRLVPAAAAARMHDAARPRPPVTALVVAVLVAVLAVLLTMGRADGAPQPLAALAHLLDRSLGSLLALVDDGARHLLDAGRAHGGVAGGMAGEVAAGEMAGGTYRPRPAQ